MKNLLFLVALAVFAGACSQGVDHSKMDHNAVPAVDHSKMDHGNMNQNSPVDHSSMKSDSDAAKAPFDLQFLDTMTHHHAGAVEMAKLIEGRTQNPEMIKFGKQIVADQEKEIAQMKEWREKWFPGKPRALNTEMPGMADSMKMDMKKLAAAKAKEFDRLFSEMMISLHAGAVTMSKDALQKSEKAEVKTLAAAIIKTQEAEIKMMESWK